MYMLSCAIVIVENETVMCTSLTIDCLFCVCFSMVPLLIKDGLVIPYFATMFLFILIISQTFDLWSGDSVPDGFIKRWTQGDFVKFLVCHMHDCSGNRIPVRSLNKESQYSIYKEYIASYYLP